MSDEEKWATEEYNPETWEQAQRIREILEMMDDQTPVELEDLILDDE